MKYRGQHSVLSTDKTNSEILQEHEVFSHHTQLVLPSLAAIHVEKAEQFCRILYMSQMRFLIERN